MDTIDIQSLFGDDPGLMALMAGTEETPPAQRRETPEIPAFAEQPAFREQPAEPSVTLTYSADNPFSDELFTDDPELLALMGHDLSSAPSGAEPDGEVSPARPAEQETQSEKPESAGKKAFHFVSNMLMWMLCLAMVGGSVMFALSNNPQKSYFGYRMYNVLTESMTPRADGSSPPGGFCKGDMIVVKLCQPEEVQAGDIITFNPNPRNAESKAFLTHRVMEVREERNGSLSFLTRGDTNTSDDPPISAQMLIGKKVFCIPKAGAILQALRQNFVLAVVTILCFFSCVMMFKWYFSHPEKKNGQKRKSLAANAA